MAETVRSELPNLWRSMNEPRACRHLYQICPQTKGRFKRQPCYARSSTDVSERGRPPDFRLWHFGECQLRFWMSASALTAETNRLDQVRLLSGAISPFAAGF